MNWETISGHILLVLSHRSHMEKKLKVKAQADTLEKRSLLHLEFKSQGEVLKENGTVLCLAIYQDR